MLDDADDYASPFESWMVPRSEADLYRRDARAEEAQRRADQIVRRTQYIALCRRSAERTWALIVKNLPPTRYRL